MWRTFALAALVGCGSRPQPPTPVIPPVPPPRTDVTAPTPVAPTPAPEPRAHADANRCDMVPTADIVVDGLLDDWRDQHVLTRVGAPADGAVAVRCAWDGTALALALDLADERIVRVKGGAEDHVTVSLAAAGRPVKVDVYPGNALAKPRITKSRRVLVADSLQPKGFSVEIMIPAAAIPELSPATSSLALHVVFHDSDAARGGDLVPVTIDQPIVLGDRKDLLDDFLAAVQLHKADIRLDKLVELEPERKGKERLVAGGTVIGVLTDRFAYVTLPTASVSDVRALLLLPLGPRGQQVIAALVHQPAKGGSRDLLMLWTVWSGQLQPLVSIVVREQLGERLLDTTWDVVKTARGAELVVKPKPSIGFSPDTWNDAPSDDADSIVLPWDPTRGGVAYTLRGAEIERRDLPKKKR